MKKIVALICMAVWLLGLTSCQENLMDGDALDVVGKEELKVQRLFQQIREGDMEAYKELAICYRDGIGVEKSDVNMLASYLMYSKRTQQDVLAVLMLIEENHPIRIIAEALNSSMVDGGESVLKRVEEVSPADAKTLRMMFYMVSEGMDDSVLTELKEAESEGSELAVLAQLMYYEEVKDEVTYEQCLHQWVERFPFLNVKIGKLYVSKYEEDGDIAHIQKAVDCYCRAEAYGMLSSWHASQLLDMYQYLDEKGIMECSAQEMDRLNKIANIK